MLRKVYFKSITNIVMINYVDIYLISFEIFGHFILIDTKSSLIHPIICKVPYEF